MAENISPELQALQDQHRGMQEAIQERDARATAELQKRAAELAKQYADQRHAEAQAALDSVRKIGADAEARLEAIGDEDVQVLDKAVPEAPDRVVERPDPEAPVAEGSLTPVESNVPSAEEKAQAKADKAAAKASEDKAKADAKTKSAEDKDKG